MKYLACATALVCLSVSATSQPQSLETFFAEFSNEWVRNDPNLATSTRYLAGEEQQRLERDLTRVDEAYQQARVDRARRGLAALDQFARASMTPAQMLAADVMRWRLEATLDGDRYRDVSFPFDQMRGVNVSLVDSFTVSHPLAVATDARNYLARLAVLPTRLDDALKEAQRMAGKGLIPPRFILETTIAQMHAFSAVSAEENPLAATFASKLDAIGDLSAGERMSLARQATSLVASQVYPAWGRVVDYLESLLPRATDAAGLWRFASGADAYAYQLRINTTTSLSADEIHRIGLEQVARIETEMNAILASLGRTRGTLTERVAQLRREQEYPATDAGRDEIIVDLNALLSDAKERAQAMFDLAPKAPVSIEAFPRFREATAPGTYSAPSPDGTRPGVFRIPLRPYYRTKFGAATLVYHETVPGHHFQIALSREDTTQPRFRQLGIFGGFPAISEGWGLYAEQLAIESGWYDGDPLGRLGALDAQLFRARRLVVDTGLHAGHWTRQQAIDYGIEAAEIDRYVVQPGQACAYMIGQLKIMELRAKAQKRLGARFSLRDFHTAVLKAGLLPLDSLEREIDRYIQSKV